MLLTTAPLHWMGALQVDGPPAFLDPEATRPLASTAAHVYRQVQQDGAAGGNGLQTQTKQAPGPDFDIAALVPRAKGQQ